MSAKARRPDAFRLATPLVSACLLLGCTSQPPSATDSRPSIRRKPAPNLDRTYDWGSIPPPGPTATHARD